MGIKNILSTIAVTALLAACTGNRINDDSEIKAAVDSFATAYFNYNFRGASRNCTAESEKWLRFAATNVIDEDIELLRAQHEGATHEVLDIIHSSDTTATANLMVQNFLKRDTLGRPGHIVDKDFISLSLIYRGGRWLVDARVSR